MGAAFARGAGDGYHPGTMQGLYGPVLELMARGGWVMWPLLGLSLVAVTLSLERGWFFVAQNGPGRLRKAEEMGRRLRAGDRAGARGVALGERGGEKPRPSRSLRAGVRGSGGVYEDVVLRMLDEPRLTEAAAVDVVESQRRRMERFMATLSTIITAAPMLGILGTVLGIIESFDVLSQSNVVRDPAAVSGGIAEALITTAAGLIVALVTLFPYNVFRGQIDLMLSRIESLAAAGMSSADKALVSPES